MYPRGYNFRRALVAALTAVACAAFPALTVACEKMSSDHASVYKSFNHSLSGDLFLAPEAFKQQEALPHDGTGQLISNSVDTGPSHSTTFDASVLARHVLSPTRFGDRMRPEADNDLLYAYTTLATTSTGQPADLLPASRYRQRASLTTE